MHACARRLTHDENACRFGGTQDRARAQRQLLLANATLAHRRQQSFKREVFGFVHDSSISCATPNSARVARLRFRQ
jgi:hypothetical protein